MKTTKQYILICIVVVTQLFNSCTEPFEIELGNSYARLIVYGEISTDTTVHSVRLSRSADYFYNKPTEIVSGAEVVISDGTTQTILVENNDNPGTYETSPSFYGIPGKKYSLSINLVDIDNNGTPESYQASSVLPYLGPLDSIRLNYADYPFFTGSEILLYAQDPAETEDYYLFKLRKNSVLQTDSIPEFIAQNDQLFNGNYTNGISVQYLDDSKPGEKVSAGDTVVFEMYGISKDYYNFIIEAQTEIRGSNPMFSGPPANVSSNLTNEALGFFAAVNVKRARAIASESFNRQ